MTTAQVLAVPEGKADLACWIDAVCSGQDPVDTRVIGETPFSGYLSVQQFGAVWLRRFRSTPVQYSRRQRGSNFESSGFFEASLTLSGRSIITQSGREVVQRPADIVLFDNARPYEYVLPDGDDQLVVGIPHALLREQLPNADALTCTVLSGASTFGGLVRQLLQGLESTGNLEDSAASGRIGSTIVDLLATAFDVEFCSDASQTPAYSRPLERVKAYMIDHLSDSELDIESIARANNISVRTLHRLFSGQGTTAMRWLWQQRLSASYKVLSVGRFKRVSDVAAMHGFTNFSHFTRSFKLTFGILPQALLRERMK
ncbi:sugar ABC transporter permease [Burkholderia sp. ABCPW 11]|uniref:AraC-like ligand-binding domain-containing protein n=1 Tax=Burkholderia sp. ABCPW 11 TaxID=1637859 RepID=UPI00075BC395|nr:helix-turn-helix domain-containing protein [Burkholderia sp. ABCPW 11]KVD46797.1 sugar ABC transporter permease [Burkholderia sp. ABCPW 11]